MFTLEGSHNWLSPYLETFTYMLTLEGSHSWLPKKTAWLSGHPPRILGQAWWWWPKWCWWWHWWRWCCWIWWHWFWWHWPGFQQFYCYSLVTATCYMVTAICLLQYGCYNMVPAVLLLKHVFYSMVVTIWLLKYSTMWPLHCYLLLWLRFYYKKLFSGRLITVAGSGWVEMMMMIIITMLTMPSLSC